MVLCGVHTSPSGIIYHHCTNHCPLPAALSTPFKLTPLTLTLDQLRKYITFYITVTIETPHGSRPFPMNPAQRISTRTKRNQNHTGQECRSGAACRTRMRVRDLVISTPQREEAVRPLRSRPAWEHATPAAPPPTSPATLATVCKVHQFFLSCSGVWPTREERRAFPVCWCRCGV